METNKHHQTRARYHNSPIITQDSRAEKKKRKIKPFLSPFSPFSPFPSRRPVLTPSLITTGEPCFSEKEFSLPSSYMSVDWFSEFGLFIYLFIYFPFLKPNLNLAFRPLKPLKDPMSCSCRLVGIWIRRGPGFDLRRTMIPEAALDHLWSACKRRSGCQGKERKTKNVMAVLR